MTIRLPPEVRSELKAASSALQRPEWRVLVDAIRAYVGNGPLPTDDERRAIRIVLRLHTK
jgi:predicted transcriptional regulator